MAGGSLLLLVENKVVLELLIRLPPLLECEITGVMTGTAKTTGLHRKKFAGN